MKKFVVFVLLVLMITGCGKKQVVTSKKTLSLK